MSEYPVRSLTETESPSNCRGDVMRAKLSPETFARSLSSVERKALSELAQKEFDSRKAVFTRRKLLAMCLALSDLYRFGDKRLGFVLQGISDILTDYAEQAYTVSESRANQTLEDGYDRMADLMQAELSARGINIVLMRMEDEKSPLRCNSTESGK